MCPTATSSCSGSKPAFPNDTSYWHRTSTRLKASALARTWSDVMCCKGTPLSMKGVIIQTALNSVQLITTLASRVIKTQEITPKEPLRPRRTSINIASYLIIRQFWFGTPTELVKKAERLKICLAHTFVSELSVILFTRPSVVRIIIHTVFYDNLQKKTGTEKKRGYWRNSATVNHSRCSFQAPFQLWGKQSNLFADSSVWMRGWRLLTVWVSFRTTKTTLNLSGVFKTSVNPDYSLPT